MKINLNCCGASCNYVRWRFNAKCSMMGPKYVLKLLKNMNEQIVGVKRNVRECHVKKSFLARLLTKCCVYSSYTKCTSKVRNLPTWGKITHWVYNSDRGHMRPSFSRARIDVLGTINGNISSLQTVVPSKETCTVLQLFNLPFRSRPMWSSQQHLRGQPLEQNGLPSSATRQW